MKVLTQYILALGLILLFTKSTSFAQAPKTYTSSELLLQIKKLKVLGSVLYIAAHPDDENTKLLAWLSNEKLYRTGYLSLTRGDGGQNLIGDEQGIDLGLIRTQELLAARRIDGAEQFFTRAYDFGYCKQPDEAFSKWGHDEVLGDVVRIIRKFKPDVIICRFPKTGEGGHGHHTASAILAEEAFEAAADSSRYPDQINNQGLKPWKTKRLLWNTFNFGGNNTQKEDQFKIDAGGFNPLLGKSYGEIAAMSRSMHKSQGFGVPSQRGESIEYFATIKGDKPQKEIIEGITTDWDREDAGMLNRYIDSLCSQFQPSNPELTVPGLIELSKKLKNLKNGNYWTSIKQQEIANLIAQCSGLWLEATSSEELIAQNDSFHFNYSVLNRSKFQWDSVIITGISTSFRLDAQTNQWTKASENDLLPLQYHTVSQPYWLEKALTGNLFEVSDPNQIGDPESKPLSVEFNIFKNDQSWHFKMPVRFKNTDPVKGEFWQPVSIVPALHIETEAPVLLCRKGASPEIHLKIIAHRNDSLKRVLNITGQYNNWILDKNITIKKGEQKSYPIHSNEGLNLLYADNSDSSYHLQLKTIRYDHIPAIHYSTRAIINRISIPVSITGKKIGYIEGAGDKVAECLKQIGYDVTELKQQDMNSSKLSEFSTVITGVRAYNTNEWLNEAYDTLMNYVKNGGNLLVQYNTSNSIGPLKAKMGPYPFVISRKRITNEQANVKYTDPANKYLNFPNKIESSDFNDWIQERSIYHATEWDSHYKTLFSMNDPGENADEGSLIYCKYGKGTFIYTGIVFFRELPAGISGAFKLIANLIK